MANVNAQNNGEQGAAAVNYMAPTLPPPGPMDCKGDVVSNWKYFKRSYTDWEIAIGLINRDMNIRLATLRTVMGRECNQVYEHLEMTPDERADIEQSLNKLEAYFQPQINTVYERYVFNKADQKADENVDEYITRLKHLACTCNYGNLEDNLIRDRLVLGTKDSKARARMLRDNNLTLQSAIDACRSSEQVQKQLSQMATPEVINAMQRNRSQKFRAKRMDREAKPAKYGQRDRANFPRDSRKCIYCGTLHEKQKEKCPAFGKTCHKCGKENHFEKVCRSATATFGQRNIRPTNTGATRRRSGRGIHALYENTDTTETESDEDVYTVEKKRGKQYFVTLPAQLQSRNHSGVFQKVKFQLDSGSTCNTMGVKDIQHISARYNVNFLKRSNVTMKLYDGTNIQSEGSCIIRLKHNREAWDVKFEIAKNAQNPILSGSTCEKMGLITMDSNVETCYKVQASQQKDSIIAEFADVFEGLGCIGGEYDIQLQDDAKPIKQQPRRVPTAMRQKLKQRLKEMEEMGVITKVPEPTEWTSNIVSVSRKKKKLRVCLDPCELNAVIKRSNYVMPTIEEILPDLANAKVFSVLDAKDGFWQVKLSEKSSYMTTFWTPWGRYRWLRMPFGLTSAPEEYQQRQHEILEGLNGVHDVADDVLITGSGENMEAASKDHEKNLREFFERARKVNLKINPAKMKLRMNEVNYMGHLLTSKGLKPDPEKVVAIQNMKRPSDAAGVLRLLGMANYLSKFCSHLSDVCQPLRTLTDTSCKFEWLEHHDEAFQKLKELVTREPTLKYYDTRKPVEIECDSSQSGLGAVLMQEGQPVAYGSRTLSKTEQNYAQIEKECLSIVYACEHFDKYILGKSDLTVYTDHKPLEIIMRKPLLAAPKRLQRMLLRLQRYSPTVKYRKGPEMFISDMLSRAALDIPLEDAKHANRQLTDYQIFSLKAKQNFMQELEEISEISPKDSRLSTQGLDNIKLQSQLDPTILSLKATILTGWPESKDEVAPPVAAYWNVRAELATLDGVIFKGSRIIIPKSLRLDFMRKLHKNHYGVESSLRRAREIAYWPRMNDEIKDYISTCSVCAELKPQQQKESLKPIAPPDLRWETVGVDLFTVHGHNYLITVDYFSDYWEIDRLKCDTTSTTVINCLKQHFARHGIPYRVYSDNGPQFNNYAFEQFSQDWNFKHQTSSPHYSQSNGKVESAVKIAKNIIKKNTKDDKDIYAAILEWRNIPTQGMNSSPIQRLMSRRTRTMLPTAKQLLEPDVIQDVPKLIKKRKEQYKHYFDRNAKDLPELTEGQLVRAQIQPGLKQPWMKGIIKKDDGIRSYIVDINGHEYRRNRKHIRSTKEKELPNNEEEDFELIPLKHGTETGDYNKTQENRMKTMQNIVPLAQTQQPKCEGQYRTRTGRVIRKPMRYRE